ncbi:MAG: DNA polymerase III subunit chi [Chlamydiales bacterium]|nr:DNA polymerase III subunit chi [Chlamydiales bacterium]
MSQKSNIQVFFHPIASNTQKVPLVCSIVKQHFFSHLHLDIITENKESLLFLDQLLWKSPTNSFIPHGSLGEPYCFIHLYDSLPTISDAKHVFNLTKTPLPLDSHYLTIHELDDVSSKEYSNNKYHFYKANSFKIATIPLQKSKNPT